jgi:peptidoglycan/xylan/chitin deacetylase (PgdA/CDA1 family)
VKAELLRRLLSAPGLRPLARHVLPWRGLLCLNYHRIGDGRCTPFDRGLWSADEESFEAQVRFLKAEFDLVSPGDIPDLRRRGRGRYVAVTFDDGFLDNYTAAFPILKAHGVPATFFIATGFIDRPRLPWWDEIAWMVRTSPRHAVELPQWLGAPVAFDEPDRERAVRALLRVYKDMPAGSTGRYLDDLGEATGTGRCPPDAGRGIWMTWDMLREMKAAGMTVGGHTVNHPVLSRLGPEAQWEEVATCGRRLAEELSEPMSYFSYPVGGVNAFDAETRRCLAQAGVRYAFSYYGGWNSYRGWDDYDVRREAVESDLSAERFRATVTLPQLLARPRMPPDRRRAGIAQRWLGW